MSKIDELLNMTRVNEMLKKHEDEKKCKSVILWIFAIVGGIAVVAGIAYAAYKFFTPDYLQDFEDDFEDDFDEDFFDDEEDEVE